MYYVRVQLLPLEPRFRIIIHEFLPRYQKITKCSYHFETQCTCINEPFRALIKISLKYFESPPIEKNGHE